MHVILSVMPTAQLKNVKILTTYWRYEGTLTWLGRFHYPQNLYACHTPIWPRKQNEIVKKLN